MVNLRFRSIPLDNSKHLSRRTAVLAKEFNEQIGEKNCYVVMSTEQDARDLVTYLNTDNRKSALGGEVVRVTLADSKDIDVKKSVFIGNLNFGLLFHHPRPHH